MSNAPRPAIGWVEQGYVPDAVIRRGVSRLCEQRLRELRVADCAAASSQFAIAYFFTKVL